MSKTFFYFAYGSNLLNKRIHINNSSARKCGIGKLKDYRLDFNIYSTRWKGCSATIVPTKGSHVWGAIYEVDLVHRESLDRQEGVPEKIYFPLQVDVETDEGTAMNCRVYQQVQTPPDCPDITQLPPERRPSAVYLNVIKEGARESGLPEEYIEFLHTITDNGYSGPVEI